jgi:hypothetical protein
MRAFEFSPLSEATISVADFAIRNSKYWINIINTIKNGSPLKIGKTGSESAVVANGGQVANNLSKIWDGSAPATPEQITAIKSLKLDTEDGKKISIGNIFKSPEIKGKEDDYNIGDIGEIAIGVAVATRFLGLGKTINLQDFLSVAARINVAALKGKSSLTATLKDSIKHPTGKEDSVNLKIMAAARSMTYFFNTIEDSSSIPKDVQGSFLSALEYANKAEKIQAGIDQTSADENSNTIDVISDGVSDQRGTKADLIMTIDGRSINLISAKAGLSQLGQASGHDFIKPKTFFSSVFGADISPYEKEWGKTNEEHLEVLKKVYANDVIPKVLKLTGGDSVSQEAELVRSIAYGLIRYSNNVKDTGEIEVVDIVKLVTDPGSPGFNLLRIDERLYDALSKVDLRGSATPNNLGVQVYGKVNNQDLLLFKARSYHSKAGKIVRTIIEGGPLLDQLAALTPK